MIKNTTLCRTQLLTNDLFKATFDLLIPYGYHARARIPTIGVGHKPHPYAKKDWAYKYLPIEQKILERK